MAEYVNPTGHVEATAGDDSFVFNVPLVYNPQLGNWTVADANSGIDSLLFDVDLPSGVAARVTGWNGVLDGRVQTGPYDPELLFYEFEVLDFVGTNHADQFELILREGSAGLTVSADVGAGDDLLIYDFSNTSVGQSFIVSGGTITSSYAQFAGFERFVITGGSGSDTIQTGDGNDFVTSSGGPNPSSNTDTVSTGGGNDSIYATTPGTYDGGAGIDDWGGNFSDSPWAPNTTALTVDIGSTITVSNGTIATNVETVSIGTASGNDTFNVTRGGSIVIYAGAGTDTLNVAMGLAQAQTFLVYTTTLGTLLGNANELGFSEVEEVSFSGGTFDDSFRVLGLFTADQISFDGGAGHDLLQGEFNLFGATSFVVNLDGTITTNRGTFTSFERFLLYGGGEADTFVTGAGDDGIFAGGGNDGLNGGAGNDTLSGESGDDVLNGGDGNDLLYGDSGADAMTGGHGDDTFRVDDVGDTVIEGSGGGVDTIEASINFTIGANVENLTLIGFDALTGTGNALANRLVGNIAANVLSGGDGDDILDGSADPYSGGNDWLIGGDGDDVFYVFFGDTITEEVGGGFDRVITTYDFELGAGAEIEVLQFEDPSGFWWLNLSGNEFANSIYGNAGGNMLSGGGGSDSIAGLGGHDTLVGGQGDDTLDGGAGFDTLDGGAGLDTAVFSGARESYAWSGTDAQATVQGPDGTDTLTGIEQLQFADGVYRYVEGFDAPLLLTAAFGAGAAAGGWSSQQAYPRLLADVDGNGRADVVGFGGAGVFVAQTDEHGVLQEAGFAMNYFGADASSGGWSDNRVYPRTLADIDGDGMADLVGFGDAGVFAALAVGGGAFGQVFLAEGGFGASLQAGGWNDQRTYPRMLADVNGDGMADLVGFGDGGVHVALALGGGSFGEAILGTSNFGAGAASGGWSDDDLYPRTLADVNGDGAADIVAFGSAGVQVALANADGTFAAPSLAFAGFGADPSAGGWTSNNTYYRTVGDVNGDGHADLVGFGDGGVHVAWGDGNGGFEAGGLLLNNFGTSAAAGGWTSQDLYPRLLADLNGDGADDIVGFGDGGVIAATSMSDWVLV